MVSQGFLAQWTQLLLQVVINIIYLGEDMNDVFREVCIRRHICVSSSSGGGGRWGIYMWFQSICICVDLLDSIHRDSVSRTIKIYRKMSVGACEHEIRS